jgi:hypothetical protein
MTPYPSRASIRLRLPRWPMTPLLGGAVLVMVATASFLLGRQTGWPGLSLLSSLGHGLTAGLLIIIGINGLVCGREARFLEAGKGQPSSWMQWALQMGPNETRMLSALRAEASARWALLFLLGCALVPLGVVASLEQLPPPGKAMPADLRPYLPLGLALLEAVLVVLAAHALDARWQDFVESWSCFLPPTPPELPTPLVEEESPDSLEALFGGGESNGTPADPPGQAPPADEAAVAGESIPKQFWWPTVK